jgi:hypothetical protein
MSTLFFCLTCLLTTLFADMDFCMKIVWFVIGLAFFGCWPVSSRYPKYRLLVSPIKWAFWEIPTHAEFAFSYLQREARKNRESLIHAKVEQQYDEEKKSPRHQKYAGHLSYPTTAPASVSSQTFSTSLSRHSSASSLSSLPHSFHDAVEPEPLLEAEDISAYRCFWGKYMGRLVISTAGIRFMGTFGSTTHWSRPYTELVEMRKDRSSPPVRIAAGILEFTFHPMGGECGGQSGERGVENQNGERKEEGDVYKVDSMRSRDEAFNRIIGFSGLEWQATYAGGNSGRSGGELGL